MVFPLTCVISEFASALTFDDIPKAAMVAARSGFTDNVACTLAGLRDSVPNRLRDALQTVGVVSEARLYLGGRTASSSDAAMANAAAAAALDFDDVALRGSHPGSVLASALWAEGDRVGASGQAILTAYVAGFETWARLIEREADAYAEKGWHATSVIGPVAGAAAVANLLGLDPAQTASALGLAAAASGGLTASFGTDARIFQVGLAARHAVMAARLAQSGFTGGATAIEANGGLLRALSPNGAVDRDGELTDLGGAWRLESGALNFKNYPMILATHRAIDGMTQLAGDHRIGLGDVDTVTLFIGPEQMAHRRRMSGGSGRFSPLASVELGLAAILADGMVGFAHLDADFHQRSDVQDFMARVSVEVDDAIGGDPEPNLGFAARLIVRTRDGRTLESLDAPVPRGNWRLPMSADQHWRKFCACTDGHLSEVRALGLFGTLQTLETVRSVREVDAS